MIKKCWSSYSHPDRGVLFSPQECSRNEIRFNDIYTGNKPRFKPSRPCFYLSHKRVATVTRTKSPQFLSHIIVRRVVDTHLH